MYRFIQLFRRPLAPALLVIHQRYTKRHHLHTKSSMPGISDITVLSVAALTFVAGCFMGAKVNDRKHTTATPVAQRISSGSMLVPDTQLSLALQEQREELEVQRKMIEYYRSGLQAQQRYTSAQEGAMKSITMLNTKLAQDLEKTRRELRGKESRPQTMDRGSEP
ncbi:hypothetical protein EK21DRAFT_107545 [Setomelanomma holmii]|uniref:Uncharacterized protein n=1 Tax=Setomelanomma holmii TaxID=210430 RepID=A0A9P4HJX4_9PLEO|nr:hypothetical protein EK21DRAFT_107545 [Setomelanomma holmii]